MLDQLAILGTSFFCGACIYVAVVEHPARLQLPLREASRQWGISYRRAAIIQPLWTVVTCVASLVRYFSTPAGSQPQRVQAHVLNFVLMAGSFTWTLLYMLPGNKALLKAETQSDSRVKQLLQAWGQQHLARTVASGVATVILVSACTSS